jgi:hypothetical protein
MRWAMITWEWIFRDFAGRVGMVGGFPRLCMDLPWICRGFAGFGLGGFPRLCMDLPWICRGFAVDLLDLVWALEPWHPPNDFTLHISTQRFSLPQR